MSEVTVNNYIPKYLLNPLSKEISKVDRAICLIASIILGIVTAGILHLLVAGYQWLGRKSVDETQNPTESDQRLNNLISPTLNLNNPLQKDLEKNKESQTPEVDDVPNEIQELLITTQAQLRELIDQIKTAEEIQHYAKELSSLEESLSENTYQFLSDTIDDPELQQAVIENTLNEFQELLSLANGILTIPKYEEEDGINPPDELLNSLTRIEWVNSAERILRKASRHCTDELEVEFNKLLSQGIDLNTTSGQWVGGTVLHQIAKRGTPLKFVSILAKGRIHFEQQDRWENTALIWAIANGKNAMAWEILEYQQNLDIQGQGNSALHLAIVKGYKDRTMDGARLTVSNFQLMQKMLENGADPDLTNRRGYSALHLACIRRDPDMISALLQAGADASKLTLDGKSCAELLDTSFEEANAFLKAITPPYLLPEEEFYNHLAACQELIN